MFDLLRYWFSWLTSSAFRKAIKKRELEAKLRDCGFSKNDALFIIKIIYDEDLPELR